MEFPPENTPPLGRRRRLALSPLVALAMLAVPVLDCGENGHPGTVTEPKLVLTAVEPTVLIKPGATAQVAFLLATMAGAPVAGQRLDFAAVDAPNSALQGATLSASTGLTDGSGIATVTVTGGLKKTKFWLSARHLRADPAQVMVMVGEGIAGTIAVVPAAAGGSSSGAALASVDVLLFDNASCAAVSVVTPSAPTAVMKVAPGTAAEFQIFSAVANAVLGQGRDADGHLRSAGCIDVPGSTVVANDTLRVYLPLYDLAPVPRSTFALSSRFSLAKREIVRRLVAPWHDLGDCPLDPGQLWLDCAIDGLGAPPGDALDCVPAASGEGELADLVSARRGSATASAPCRAATVGGVQSLDAKVAALFPNPAQSPASDIDAMAAALGAMFDDITLGSTLELNATAASGSFQATHTLRTILFPFGAQSVSVDVVAQGAPDAQARLIPVITSGDLLTIEGHNLGLHLGTLARTAFTKAALTVGQIPLPAGQSAVANFVDRLFALAANSTGAGRTAGCEALDAVVCADVARTPGCLRLACIAGQAALAARLDASFAVLDGEGTDLQLSGSAVMTDADQDGIAEQLGGTASNPGLWTGQLRARGGTETIGGSWAGMPP